MGARLNKTRIGNKIFMTARAFHAVRSPRAAMWLPTRKVRVPNAPSPSAELVNRSQRMPDLISARPLVALLWDSWPRVSSGPEITRTSNGLSQAAGLPHLSPGLSHQVGTWWLSKRWG